MSLAVETPAADLIGGEAPTPTAAPASTTAAPKPPAPVENRFAGVTDSIGRKFDPAKFAMGADGPRFDSMRRFINANAGRKPAIGAPSKAEKPGDSAPAGSSVLHVPNAPAAPAETPQPIETVETVIGVIQTALIMIGEDEGVLSEAEKMLLRKPLERVVKKYELGELPCELDLAMAVAGVVISRLSKPKTQGRIERFKMWIAGKVADHRGAKRAEKIAAHTGNA